MVELSIFGKILIALILGAVLGLETESRSSQEGEDLDDPKLQEQLRQRLGGLRTYTILALFGAIAGVFTVSGNETFTYLIFVAIILIVTAAYILNVWQHKAFGMTTEIAIFITFLAGYLTVTEFIPLQIIIAITVILAFILSQKRGAVNIIRSLGHHEIEETLKFAIISVVVLPFLPNQDFLLGDLIGLIGVGDLNLFGQLEMITIINPFRIWTYVILISGFNLLAYILNKFMGDKGSLIFSGIFGGMVSSTSTVAALAINSEDKPKERGEGFGSIALIAHAVSFLQILILAFSASIVFGLEIFVLSILFFLFSLGVSLAYLNRGDKKGSVKIEYKSFTVWPALQFATLLVVARVVIEVVNLYLGDSAFLLATALSGLVGIDVATITLGELVSDGSISISFALITFLVVNLVNFLAKAIYSAYRGSHDFAKVVNIGMISSAIAGMLAVLVLI